ncbi:PA2778 family cysteine peptidase [Alishewanella sp. BS5-314]|uniref:PA2778 family cysteine peptidase n=1 Tax=Alishewanella sp. BS5-314 TaxID=2755587 RepID=UPI0021BADDD6|nr:PA2778 family cysteine peptidase [Alishewanella sp. BS5-314]MCT8124545.1 PA2778 family cysteine peptidase [Alishewanella sp. BS5-314]
MLIKYATAGLKIGLLLTLLLLVACQSPPQSRQLLAEPPAISRQALLSTVPFYPQQDYFCGPTTLSEVAAYYGVEHSADSIASLTFTPGLQGSLQIEMAAASRQLGFVAYEQRGSLSQLLQLIDEKIPVIVLQNNGLSWLPQWHYAVVIGYDLDRREIILHSGLSAEYRLPLATFERTWHRANYWLLAMLPPGRTSALLDPFLYTRACQDLLQTRQTTAGVTALISATEQWPDYWLPYFLLGNHFLAQAPAEAATWFAQGLPLARQQPAYLNNYALVLSELGCKAQALELIKAARRLAPDDANIQDSEQQIRASVPAVCTITD